MKLTVKTKNLLRACQFAVKSLKPNSPLPALSHLLMVPEGERLKIIGSDLETTSSMTCEADISDPQQFCAPAAKLINLLGSSTGEDCQISMVKDRIHVEIGMAKSQISTIPPEDFPALKDVSGESVTIQAENLNVHLGRVIFAASKDSQRIAFTGVKIELKDGEIRFTAVSGKILATSFEAGEGSGDILVPMAVISKVASAATETKGPVVITHSERAVSFKFSDCEISGKLIEETYPQWRNSIPAEFKQTITIDRKAIVASLKRCKLFVNDNFFGVDMSFNGTLTVTAETPVDTHSEVLECSKCEPLELRMNHEDLINIASRMEGDKITIHATDALSPIMVKEGDFMCMSMCMRGKVK